MNGRRCRALLAPHPAVLVEHFIDPMALTTVVTAVLIPFHTVVLSRNRELATQYRADIDRLIFLTEGDKHFNDLIAILPLAGRLPANGRIPGID